MKENLKDFEWPEFNTDSKRIRAYSKRYKDMTIAEAFNACYDMGLTNVSERTNEVPQELQLGDVITARITSIDKNKISFDAGNFKTNVTSNINLYKYDRFKHFIPTDLIKAKVVNIQKDRVSLDPIMPMLEDWLDPILKDPTVQKKSKYVPGEGYQIDVVKVKNLQLTKGGFMGKAVIPSISEFVGEDYTVDAFIPGSQIVLNITDDFDQFIGKDVYAFVLNYIPKPGNSGMSLICSVKEVLKYIGELNMIQMFGEWCDETEVWKGILEKTYEGKVTGIINSSKKCGVFVEIPELNITGMVQTKPEELVGYKPHETVGVKITGFEEELFYNAAANQMQHAEPYVIEDGCLKKCSLKPILKFA
jgi:ribosomal protein S1